MTYHRWTEEEESYLERYVADSEERGTTLQEVADFLEIPIQKVRSKVHWMRKEKGYENMVVRKRYTSKEEQFIKDNYPHMRTEDIAERMDRSVESIRDKAKNLGVRKLIPIAVHDDLIRKMAANGYYRGEIANVLGLHRKSLDTYIRLNRIPCENVSNGMKTKEFRKGFDTR